MNNSQNRDIRVKVALETLKILEAGLYTNHQGTTVDIKEDLKIAIDNTILYKPDSFENIENEIEKIRNEKESKKPIVEITDETTISAARRLVVDEGFDKAVCLNFASAKNPGGGFLSGSQAQEESLARSSGLYPCISQMKEMYDYNRGIKTCLYSDYMIYSPKVPVFRDDNNRLLKEAFLISFITAPAVNAGVVREREKGNIEKIHSVMISRIKKILLIAALNNNRAIVLGAYGCGVFKNKTEDVAEYFRKVLHEDGYKLLFDRITFAIYDSSVDKAKIREFERALL
ncbi:TIGR02452 family protein [Acetivibrio cellulolyticus]|uniref:TIGR02452 family protein n=1 Tax=Acetivibrio cellulolyticus TaxID=35830 RepID=UPI0001E2D10A|nr:TIGR02452 family protein [Acetivibrio cellulolyticus]